MKMTDWICQQKLLTEGKARKDSGVFSCFFSGLWNCFLEMVRQREGHKIFEGMQIQYLFQDEFTAKLQRMAVRVLISELHEEKDKGNLRGKNANEEYAYYIQNFLLNQDYLAELQQNYPVLFRNMDNFINREAENLCQMLRELKEEREQINGTLFEKCPFRCPLSVKSGNSDGHFGGKQVYLLTLDNGEKLVYKPRSLKLDIKFTEFAADITENAGIRLYPYKVLDCGHHGWTEYIEQKPCSTPEEAERYFQRIGAWICLSYCCNSSDLHYENLIAHGEYPVVIDLETILEPDRGGVKGVEELFKKSVLSSGFLPIASWDRSGDGINISAVNGGKAGTFLMNEMPYVKAAGTSGIQIAYQKPEIKPGKNQARLGERLLSAADYRLDIAEGFQRVYRYIMEHKKEIKDSCKRFKGCRVRVLLRHTQAYHMVMNISCYPDFYKNEQAHSMAFRYLYQRKPQNSAEEWIWKQEMRQMSDGDIPYFYREIGGNALWAGNGASFPEEETEQTLVSVTGNVERFSGQDMKRQMEWIKMATAYRRETKSASQRDNYKDDGTTREEQYKKIAEVIGERILDNAVITEDKTDIGWMQMSFPEEVSECVHLKETDYYLYDGLAGIFVFLTVYREICPSERLERVICIIRSKLFAYTEQLAVKQETKGKLPTGIFHGEASVVYAYLIVFQNTKEICYLEYAKKHASALKEFLKQDEQFDLIGGNAGAILVLIKLSEVTGNTEYLETAKEAAGYLMEQASEEQKGMLVWSNAQSGCPLAGMSHGTSGMLLAFARLFDKTNDNSYMEIIRKIQAYEDRLFIPETGDWQDLRASTPERRKQKAACAWCHGKGGILFGRYLTKDILKDNFSGKTKLDVEMREEFCVCHGNIGNAVMQSAMSDCGMQAEGEKLWEKIVNGLYENIEEPERLLLSKEWYNFGFMAGLSGIGYYILSKLICIYDVLKMD